MANSSSDGILSKLVGRAETDTQRDARTTGVALAWALVIGLFFAITWQPKYWAAACMWAGACTLLGMLLGFLFGIPRFLARSGPTVITPRADAANKPSAAGGQQQPAAPAAQGAGGQQQPAAPAAQGAGGQQQPAAPAAQGADGEQQPAAPAAQGADGEQQPAAAAAQGAEGQQQPAAPAAQAPDQQPPQSGVNTNLEEISDWLTKIIVGVSLVEIKTAQAKLQDAAGFIAQTLGGSSQTSFAYGLMMYFAIAGFLGSYLLTRLFLQRAFREAA
jgi:hypothetical protein